jgi:catechol 2,3-dioxygenase-like lactoylglutathione lyase family enzyme
MPIKVEGCTPLIQVFDMPASLAFYRDKLGFEVIGDSGRSVDFQLGHAEIK